MESNGADRTLEAISDGQWHNVSDLQKKLKCNKFQNVLRFLTEYDFIIWDKPNKRVKLSESSIVFLRKKFG